MNDSDPKTPRINYDLLDKLLKKRPHLLSSEQFEQAVADYEQVVDWIVQFSKDPSFLQPYQLEILSTALTKLYGTNYGNFDHDDYEAELEIMQQNDWQQIFTDLEARKPHSNEFLDTFKPIIMQAHKKLASGLGAENPDWHMNWKNLASAIKKKVTSHSFDYESEQDIFPFMACVSKFLVNSDSLSSFIDQKYYPIIESFHGLHENISNPYSEGRSSPENLENCYRECENAVSLEAKFILKEINEIKDTETKHRRSLLGKLFRTRNSKYRKEYLSTAPFETWDKFCELVEGHRNPPLLHHATNQILGIDTVTQANEWKFGKLNFDRYPDLDFARSILERRKENDRDKSQ